MYYFFGENFILHNLIGVLFGYLGIISMYYTVNKLSGQKQAVLASLLLSVNPLFIASGIYGLNDFIITTLILVSISFYLYRKLVLFSAVLTLLVLTKETAILAILIFLFIDFFFSKKKAIRIIFPYIFPLIVYTAWSWFLQNNGKGAWKDWIFTDTADKGTFYTIVNNIITLKIFNIYALEHWAQLIFLNFNWIVIILAIILAFLFFSKKSNTKHFWSILQKGDQKSKSILFIITFCFLYGISVLTLQTYTIPRYALPLISFLLLWFSALVLNITKRSLRNVILGIVFVFTLLGLFGSIDPVATVLWGKVEILGQSIYATNVRLSGNDGITYNLQYLLIARKRTELLTKPSAQPVLYQDCMWLSPDPRNDLVTFSLFKLRPNINTDYCSTNLRY